MLKDGPKACISEDRKSRLTVWRTQGPALITAHLNSIAQDFFKCELDPLNAHSPAAATRMIGSEDLSIPGSRSIDEADGWFLLGPLVITKGILAKGVRVLFEQRKSIQKVGKALRNMYHRHNSAPRSSRVFSPPSPSENDPEPSMSLSQSDLDALLALGRAYLRFYEHLSFVDAWGQEDVPPADLDEKLIHAHYADNLDTFHEALQAFRDHDSPALHNLTRQALNETLAFEREIAQMCSWED